MPSHTRWDIKPVQLKMDDAQVLGARWDLDVEQRFDGPHEGHRVEVVREVVHPLDDWDHLPVRLALGGLLDPRVDVADERLDVADDLALERGEQPEHAVRRRVMRPDVERQQLVALLDRLGRERDRFLAAAVVVAHCHLP